ncbi:MAG: amidase, partial [Ramlibacter sp.]|nr:amidase [Ramlibacter sp.]
VWDLLEPPVREALAAPRARIEAALGAARPVGVVLDSFEAMYWHFRHIQGREAWLTDGPFIERYAPPLGPGVKERFAWSRAVTDEQFAAGTAFRARFRAHLLDLLGSDGVLLMPTMPDVAPLIAADDASLEGYRNRAIHLLCIAGLSGFPQLSLPLATRLGAPLGLSLLGPPGSDRSLVRLAEQVAAHRG